VSPCGCEGAFGQGAEFVDRLDDLFHVRRVVRCAFQLHQDGVIDVDLQCDLGFHLGAFLAVQEKLRGKSKGRQVVINHLIPYPAAVSQTSTGVTIRLLDFEDLSATSESRETALSLAQDQLLRRLMTSLRDADPIPPPDQYLEMIDERRVVMVDPLAAAC